MADKITMDKLAGMIKRGFDNNDKQFIEVRAQFPPIYKELVRIGDDVREIKAKYVYREEFEDVLARLALVERKLSINSGKL